MEVIEINVSELPEISRTLTAGQRVLLTGTVYTARDAAHKKLIALIDANSELPFDISGAVIYYAGPTPSKPGFAVGSCGPTTSARMDKFAPELFARGLAATIGKGEIGSEVADAIRRSGAVYLCAVGGAGALIARHITSAEEIAFTELGCESVKRLTVDKLPLFVGLDANGGNIFCNYKL
ncbi:MAG: FumA C-terminus/TtdB family hydratase beta subunit [Oscillospiraceae bacterium]|jgi:fumarate hydratase subunit beta|nr:FumA C-terminus/TtdB family hydratase beta subunit [Oscillospiraceae bacterium]